MYLTREDKHRLVSYAHGTGTDALRPPEGRLLRVTQRRPTAVRRGVGRTTAVGCHATGHIGNYDPPSSSRPRDPPL